MIPAFFTNISLNDSIAMLTPRVSFDRLETEKTLPIRIVSYSLFIMGFSMRGTGDKLQVFNPIVLSIPIHMMYKCSLKETDFIIGFPNKSMLCHVAETVGKMVLRNQDIDIPFYYCSSPFVVTITLTATVNCFSHSLTKLKRLFISIRAVNA